MRLTTPASSGWMTLVRDPTTVLPGATATISSLPMQAHSSATVKNAMIVRMIQREAGETGVSVNSRCAGRKASSSSVRAGGSRVARTDQAALNTSV